MVVSLCTSWEWLAPFNSLTPLPLLNSLVQKNPAQTFVIKYAVKEECWRERCKIHAFASLNRFPHKEKRPLNLCVTFSSWNVKFTDVCWNDIYGWFERNVFQSWKFNSDVEANSYPVPWYSRKGWVCVCVCVCVWGRGGGWVGLNVFVLWRHSGK